jgi:predicted permease
MAQPLGRRVTAFLSLAAPIMSIGFFVAGDASGSGAELAYPAILAGIAAVLSLAYLIVSRVRRHLPSDQILQRRRRPAS